MRFKIICLCLAFVFMQQTQAQEDAQIVLKQAYKQAKSEKKNVLLIFHASWCGWCKKMEANIMDESCKDLFENNYVLAYLDVNESNEKKHLENPGALDVLRQYNGEKSGLPFWVFLDKKGKLLEDSFNAENQNIGCPASESEVAQFVEKLKSTSNLETAELAIIEERFIIKK